MDKDVIVSINGVQMADGEQQDVELITRGSYFYKNGKHYVVYEEAYEDEAQKAHNTMKIADGSLELIKTGLINTRMVFCRGRKNESSYQTPFGMMVVGIEAKEVLLKEEADVLTIDILYALDINYEHVSDCTMNIRITSAQKASLGLAEEAESDAREAEFLQLLLDPDAQENG